MSFVLAVKSEILTLLTNLQMRSTRRLLQFRFRRRLQPGVVQPLLPRRTQQGLVHLPLQRVQVRRPKMKAAATWFQTKTTF